MLVIILEESFLLPSNPWRVRDVFIHAMVLIPKSHGLRTLGSSWGPMQHDACVLQEFDRAHSHVVWCHTGFQSESLLVAGVSTLRT